MHQYLLLVPVSGPSCGSAPKLEVDSILRAGMDESEDHEAMKEVHLFASGVSGPVGSDCLKEPE